MSDADDQPHLYRELADWWPLLSAPEDYAEEADFFRRTILAHATEPPLTMLELGSGGGNNASHLKKHFQMTLVDLSPGMLGVSRKLNPECEHFPGDMRNVRLGREFDSVIVADAVLYMTTEDDLRRMAATVCAHCRPGGVFLIAPDHTRETFVSETGHGGTGDGRRSLRYLEWNVEPEPGATTYVSEMVYLLREENGEVRCIHDRHTLGLFPREVWVRVLTEAGLTVQVVPFAHSEFPRGVMDVFVGRRG